MKLSKLVWELLYGKMKVEDRIKIHNEKKKILSSVDEIEKKGKEIKKKKHWLISGIGIAVLLLLWPIKKLIEKFL